MPAPVEVKLRPHDKGKLSKIVKAGTEKSRTITRCRILLLTAEKKNPSFIRDALGCTIKTVQNVKERYKAGGIDRAVYDAPRSGAPTVFDGKARAKLTA